MFGGRIPRGTADAWILVYVLVVCALSAAKAAGLISASMLAASPAKIGAGRLWLLVSSGLIVDRPAFVSLACFAALAAVSLVICGGRIVWCAALAGHVCSTLLVYVAIGLVRLGQPYAFETTLTRPDYGVSAVSAAWLGATAAICWNARARTAAGRLFICGSCGAVAVFAYSVHPDRSVLASEHLVAFAIGVACVSPGARDLLLRAGKATAGRFLHGRVDPVVAGIGAAAALILTFAGTPVAFATLSSLISDNPASVARCASAWNRSLQAPQARVARLGASYAVITTTRSPKGVRRNCSISFYGEAGAITVSGHWSDGRVSTWHTPAGATVPSAPANATVSRGGELQLRRVGSRR